MKAPNHLSHKPIIAVNDYDKIDGKYLNQTDAKALSIGQAQYDENELSLKIWRHSGKKWSRQSEEMPLHRALDLSILTIASILTDEKSKYPLTSLREVIVSEDRVAEIKNYYKHDEGILRPKLEELRNILNTFFDKEK